MFFDVGLTTPTNSHSHNWMFNSYDYRSVITWHCRYLSAKVKYTQKILLHYGTSYSKTHAVSLELYFQQQLLWHTRSLIPRPSPAPFSWEFQSPLNCPGWLSGIPCMSIGTSCKMGRKQSQNKSYFRNTGIRYSIDTSTMTTCTFSEHPCSLQ